MRNFGLLYCFGRGAIFKGSTIALLVTFCSSILFPASFLSTNAYAQTILGLPTPGTMVNLSAPFAPAVLRGMKVFPDNPLRFDFIIDKGDSGLGVEDLQIESSKIIKYFLASLTVPEKDLWVNLSPYEKDRIVPETFGITEMGRDLLAQDYLLKQITASLIYPEDKLGKSFWERVYAKARKMYGAADIPVSTFNKVWIVPQKAVVYEHEDVAYVVESRLKVMLEEDYLSARNEGRGKKDEGREKQGTTEIIREVIIPEIEKEVNEGKNFTPLRQIYQSMILATWFKKNFKESLLGQIYVGQGRVKGVDVEDKAIKQKIYEQYLKAFKVGVYNYIKEDYDPATQDIVPRKYFSGGVELTDFAMLGDVYEETGDMGKVQIVKDGNMMIASTYLADAEKSTPLSPPKEEDETANNFLKNDQNVNLHLELPYKDSMLDVILNPEIVAVMQQASLIPQEFVQEAIDKIEQGVVPGISKSRVHEFRRDSYGNAIQLYDIPHSGLWMNLSPRVVKQLLFAEIWKKLKYAQTYWDKFFERKPSYTNFKLEEYYRQAFTTDDLLVILKGFILSQNIIPSEIYSVIFSVRAKYSEGHIDSFKQFLNEHLGTMDIDSQLEAYNFLSVYDLSFNEDEMKETIEGLERKEAVLRDLRSEQTREMMAMLDNPSAPRDISVAILEEIAAIDPQSRRVQEELKEAREKVAEQKQESEKRQAGIEKAEKFKDADINIVFSEIISALRANDQYYALPLFQAVSRRDGLELFHLNALLALLPHFHLLGYQEAAVLSRKLTDRYRDMIIDKVVSESDLDPSQREPLKKFYKLLFQESSPNRLYRIKEELFFPIEETILSRMEDHFGMLKDQLQDEQVHFNYLLREALSKNIFLNISQLQLQNSPSYLRTALEDALKEEKEVGQKLEKTREYFQAVYGIELDIPFAEEVPLDKIRGGPGGRKSTLYSRQETAHIIEKLIIVDRALARLPYHLLLNSLSFQKFYIVKDMRAFWQHSETIKNNFIALALDSPHMLQTFYHEFGHSLHGPDGDFAAYINPETILEVLSKHADFFKSANLDMSKLDSSPGAFMWDVFQFLYNQRLAEWEEFNRTIGIDDVNVSFKARNPEDIEKRYGISVSRSADELGEAGIIMEYIFEKPLEDSFDGKFRREEPVEFIAEHTQLYVLHPEALQKLDEVSYDVLRAIIGNVSPSRDAAISGQSIEDKLKKVEVLNNSEKKRDGDSNTAAYETDRAMAAQDVGGIDLTPDQINIETRGKGFKFTIPFDPAKPETIPRGFTPIIIQMTPVTNLPFLLGVDIKASEQLNVAAR